MSNPDALPPDTTSPRDAGNTATAADWAAVRRALDEVRVCSSATRRRFGAALEDAVRRRVGVAVAWPDLLWMATAAEAEGALDRADPRRLARRGAVEDAVEGQDPGG